MSDSPPPVLDDQLCFALYAASRTVTTYYRPLLQELGLTYPQYLVMLVLWERGPVPVKDLASALELDYGTLSPLLKRLAAAGLVARERREDDERSVLIAPTAAGSALRTRAANLPIALGAAMQLSRAERSALNATLRKLARDVAAATDT